MDTVFARTFSAAARSRHLGFLVLVVCVFFAAALASAQQGPVNSNPVEDGGDLMQTIMLIGGAIATFLVGLFYTVDKLITRMAARPQVDGWDDALEVTKKLKPFADTIKRWADPDDPEVPPSPTNKSGTAS